MVDGPLLFDTNVLIYALNATRDGAQRLLQSRADHAISIITWMEVNVGAPEGRESETERFLANFEIIDLSRDIATDAVSLRRQFKVKLPDAVIYATALRFKRTLVTYNVRDFPVKLPHVHIPRGLGQFPFRGN